jgi:sugar O-acyltransferase (sialic acid O-acetyltransferase NeuD family)
MEKDIILVGGGGHCKSVIDVVESAGYKIIGILAMPSEVGKQVLSYNIIGTDDDMYKFVKDALFLVTVGQIKSASLRIKLHEMIQNAGGKLATIIASTAYVSQYAQVGEGTVIMHNAFVNAGAKIGKGCIINTFANIEHDTVIGDFCHISTGSMINGNCVVGNRTFIGSQSVINNEISICDDCVISSGNIVYKSIIKNGIYRKRL